METHAYTPGPWIRADHNFVYALNNQKSNRFCLSVIAGHELLTSSTSIRTSYEEIAANAYLIAAAPDMLEALKNLENDDGHIPLEAWKMVQSAIAKATNQNQPQ